eukprot:TRINITY_DN25004_c0_g1_i1.p1 TRINITY_DN25004_c0_g1~~TRINITY_DN25004_c0_g1_i1.p1  ORF type:complete len:595 (+),score=97.90 TRINITY_DN25004_c0_g1_i1:25-1785(+)
MASPAGLSLQELREELHGFGQGLRGDMDMLCTRIVKELHVSQGLLVKAREAETECEAECEAPSRPPARLAPAASHAMPLGPVQSREGSRELAVVRAGSLYQYEEINAESRRHAQHQPAWAFVRSASLDQLEEINAESRRQAQTRPALYARASMKTSGRQADVIHALSSSGLLLETQSEQLSLWQRARLSAAACVTDHKFDAASAVLVLASSAWVGYRTDYIAQTWVKQVPLHFHFVDLALCVSALIELIFRIIAGGSSFFYGDAYKWNWFDFVCVFCQIIDAIQAFSTIEAVKAGIGSKHNHLTDFRIARLARIMRVGRMASVFPELHLLIVSILDSLSSLFWVMVLIVASLYACAIFITQVVNEHKMQRGLEHMDSEAMLMYYDSLGSTMYSLFLAISGGISWCELVTPLQDNISQWSRLLFVIFTSFQVFAMMNVVTACFVDGAMKNASSAEEHEVLAMLEDTLISEAGCAPEDVRMTRETFRDLFVSPNFKHFFQAMGAEKEDPDMLWALLDNGEGSLTIQEFLDQVGKLPRTAMSFQVAWYSSDLKSEFTRMHSEVTMQLSALSEMLQQGHRTSDFDPAILR